MKNFLTIMASLFLLHAVCPAHAAAENESLPPDTQLTLEDLRTFTDVFNQLRTNFVDEVDDHTLLVAAIDGMISRLDPWSAFLDSEQSQLMDDSAKGRYGGIGIGVDMRDGRIYVQSVYPQGPADKAGIQTGDLILEVEGRPVRGRRVSESLNALTGEPGSGVRVRFKSIGHSSREVVLEREYILVSSVIHEQLEDGKAYFRISHFHRNTHVELEQAIAEATVMAGGRLSGIILDLRGNPGGVVLPAVSMADGFLDEGMIVYTQGRYEASLLEFRAEPGQWAPEVPVVILVDGNTASASEVLAGALQDHGRALILGEKTFGKGSIQSIFNLRNGSMLKLTTARYFTPSGRTIHNNGIEPDVASDAAAESPEFDGTPDTDHVVQQALGLLEKIKES